MLYAAFTFWLLVIVFSAWGVHALCSRIFKPRVVNGALLPGTLVAQLGHVLGLLITGNPVRNTSLMGEDDDGKPKSETPEKPRIPVLGPIVVGSLPLLACGAGLFAATHYLGGPLMAQLGGGQSVSLPTSLPNSLAGAWDVPRLCISMAEQMFAAIRSSDLTNWRNLLFIYLAICLSVRMTPFEDSRRGALGAILLAGAALAALSLLTTRVPGWLLDGWPILSLAAAMLFLLLVLSLAVTGIVELVRVLAKGG